MALRSMTGFGRANVEVDDIDVIVEIRSVNHKGLDVKVGVPGSLSGIETRVLKLVKRNLHRGRVDVRIKLGARGGNSRYVLDFDAARQLAAQLEDLRNKLGMAQPVEIADLLKVRDQIFVDPSESSFGEGLWPEVLAVVQKALDLHIDERNREGEVLASDLSARLLKIKQNLSVVEEEIPRCKDEYLAGLRERLAETVERFGLAEIPEERLLQEVVIFADRSDVAEEITRANAHVEMLLGLIASHDPSKDPVGKKLDFYFQELIRETNTLGSKSQSAVIAGCVVEMRSEIDRLREQVLNVS